MAIVDRIKGIILKPSTEWDTIAVEEATTGSLFKGYVLPLAAIGPIAGFVGNSVIGRSIPFVGSFRIPIGTGLGVAISSYVTMLIGVFVLSLIINALAPRYGGEKNSIQALKLAVFSYTPGWIAAAFQVVTMLGLLALAGALYGLYVLYLGLPKLMKCPKERAMGYTVVIVLCAIGLAIATMLVGKAFGMSATPGAAAYSGLTGERTGGEVQFDKDSALGKLQALGKAMEKSNQKMEAAQRSGDPAAQTAAAMEALGTMMGGGKRVQPVGIDQLKPLIPDSFAGLPKKGSKAEKAGVAGLMISKAEATYADGGKRVSLDVSDTGGASGMLALAGWAGVQGEKEDDDGFERTQTVEGRLVHEKGSKTGGSNEFTIILGQRFIVSAKGHGVELADLKKAVAGMDLGKLEAMKDSGVQK